MEKKEKIARALKEERNRLTKMMQERHLSLVLAESCTGGALANHITNDDMAGYLLLSIIAYDPWVKVSVLGLPQYIIDTYGLYSSQTAVGMALAGLIKVPKAYICGASTGIIGRKDRNDPDKKRGEVYLAVAMKEGFTKYRIVVGKYFLEKKKGEKRSKIKKRAGVELFKLIQKVVLEPSFGSTIESDNLIPRLYKNMEVALKPAKE